MLYFVTAIGLFVGFMLLMLLIALLLKGLGLTDKSAANVSEWIFFAVLALYLASQLTACKPKPAPAKPYEPLPADTVRPKLEQKVQQADSTRVERTQESQKTQTPYEKAAAAYDAERRRLGL